MSDQVNLLDSLLTSPSKVSLLRTFLSLDKPVTGREAARLAGVTQRPAVRSLQELVALGILVCEKHPTHHLYSINRDNYLVQNGLAPLFSAEKTRGSALFVTLRKMFEEGKMARMRDSIESVAAYVTSGPQADQINLLVIAANERAQSEIWRSLLSLSAQIEEVFGAQVAAEVLTPDELTQRYVAGDAAIRRAATASSVVVGRPLAEILPSLVEMIHSTVGAEETEETGEPSPTVGSLLERGRSASGVIRFFSRRK